MGKSYYVLMLRKDDIVDLYKYGMLYPYCNYLCYDDCSQNQDLSELAADDKFAEMFFKKCNPFDYSIEYYIVVVESTNIKKGVFIQDIHRIYALDDESYRIGLDFNPKIIMSDPIWQSKYNEFRTNMLFESAKDGIVNVGKIFKIEKLGKSIRCKTINEDILAVCKDHVLGCSVQGERSVWYYLLSYERHQNYPKDNRGYFLDMLHVFSNWTKKKEIDSDFRKHPIGMKINQSDGQLKFSVFWEMIKTSEKELYDKLNACDKQYFKIAPLFFWLKDQIVSDFSDLIETQPNFISMIDKKLSETPEIKGALMLLGCVSGRFGTYKCVYKRDETIRIIKQSHIKNIHEIVENQEGKPKELEPIGEDSIVNDGTATVVTVETNQPDKLECCDVEQNSEENRLSKIEDEPMGNIEKEKKDLQAEPPAINPDSL